MRCSTIPRPAGHRRRSQYGFKFSITLGAARAVPSGAAPLLIDVLRIALRGALGHARRLVATAAAVVLGVTFLTGTLVLQDTTQRRLGEAFGDAYGGTDAAVRGTTEVGRGADRVRGPVSAEVVAAVRATSGVHAAAPVVERPAEVVSRGEPVREGPTWATSWVPDPVLSPWAIAQGRPPQGADEVVLDQATATAGDLEVGDSVTVRVPDPLAVTVVGIATFGGAEDRGGAGLAALEPDTADTVLTGGGGEATHVLVAGEEGVSTEELIERLSEALPALAEAVPAARLIAEQDAMADGRVLGATDDVLLVFVGIALVVTAVGTHTTFSILVAQRTRESALLRALGASRRQVLAGSVVEAALIGLVAAIGGLIAGTAASAGLLVIAQRAGEGLAQGTLRLDAGTITTGLVVGVAVTVTAAVLPARRAARVAPLAAVCDVAVDRSHASGARIVTGLFILATGIVSMLAASLGNGSLARAGLGAAATLSQPKLT